MTAIIITSVVSWTVTFVLGGLTAFLKRKYDKLIKRNGCCRAYQSDDNVLPHKNLPPVFFVFFFRQCHNVVVELCNYTVSAERVVRLVTSSRRFFGVNKVWIGCSDNFFMRRREWKTQNQSLRLRTSVKPARKVPARSLASFGMIVLMAKKLPSAW